MIVAYFNSVRAEDVMWIILAMLVIGFVDYHIVQWNKKRDDRKAQRAARLAEANRFVNRKPTIVK